MLPVFRVGLLQIHFSDPEMLGSGMIFPDPDPAKSFDRIGSGSTTLQFTMVILELVARLQMHPSYVRYGSGIRS